MSAPESRLVVVIVQAGPGSVEWWPESGAPMPEAVREVLARHADHRRRMGQAGPENK